MKNRTTLQTEKAVLEELRKCKKYKRETYTDVLKRLIRKDKQKLK